MRANLLKATGSIGFTGLLATSIAFSLGGPALADDYVPPGGTIAYAVTGLHWATYQKDVKRECPEGLNIGVREQFSQLFPDVEHKQYTLVGTELRREVDMWFPTVAPDLFPFHEVVGTIAIGMNLDGKIGPHDFTSPEGEKGIDNQLYRVLGCLEGYRDGGWADHFNDEAVGKEHYNRIILELTGVQSLESSPHVHITIYRGLDPLVTGGIGNDVFLPGGTERVDTRWGRKFIQHLEGSITNGVLKTEPKDITFAWATFNLPTDQFMRAARFQLKLTPTGAEGLIGGYTDVETWFLQRMKSESTHHQGYGHMSEISIYKVLRRLADGYPDPKTGQNTAISSALRARFVQVYLVHPQNRTLEAAETRLQVPYAGAPFPRSAAEEVAESTSKLASNSRPAAN